MQSALLALSPAVCDNDITLCTSDVCGHLVKKEKEKKRVLLHLFQQDFTGASHLQSAFVLLYFVHARVEKRLTESHLKLTVTNDPH